MSGKRNKPKRKPNDPVVQTSTTNNPQKQHTSQLITEQHAFSGPLPHPEILAKYNEITPGFAERIISMAEKEQNHQHECDKILISEDTKLPKRGQWFGLFSIIIIGGIAITLAYLKSHTAAGIFGGVSLVGIIGAFMNVFKNGKKQKK